MADTDPPFGSTEKAEGMFATIIIILPLLYTGGEVDAKHGSVTETFQFPPFSTSALAWYTEVMHEV